MKLLFIFSLFFVLISCHNSSEEANITERGDVVASTFSEHIDVLQEGSANHNDFSNFTKNFELVNLPFELKVGDDNWIDFQDSKSYSEISRELIIKYMFEGLETKFENSSFDRYYFGFKINLKNNLTGLLYYRVHSEGGYTGYVLGIFQNDGTRLDEMLFSGTSGLYDIEGQKESRFNLDNEIIQTEIKFDINNVSDPNDFEAIEVVKLYKLIDTGKIEYDSLISEVPYNFFYNKNKSYRIERLK